MTPFPIRRLTAVTTFLAFIPLAVSGLVMLLLPGGGGSHSRGFARTVEFLGISRHGWSEFHETVAIVFLIAAVLHLVCNWKAMKRHLGLGRPRHTPVARNYL